MAVLLIVISILLGSRYYTGEKQSDKIEELKSGFALVCPELSACGDAFLLYDEDEAVLIDTGEAGDADRLLGLLEERGVTSLDAMILTHYDKDHIGGAPTILKNLQVKNCFLTCGTEDTDEYRKLIKGLDKAGTKQIVVTETESFRLMGARFTIYPPLTAVFEKNQDNNLSLIVGVDAPEDKLLFTGDAEKERMVQYVEKQYDGTEYTWLKVPHHGRDKKTVKMLLSLFVPKDAVICSSEDEPEDEKVVDLLQDKGVKVWLTREDTAEFRISTREKEDGEDNIQGLTVDTADAQAGGSSEGETLSAEENPEGTALSGEEKAEGNDLAAESSKSSSTLSEENGGRSPKVKAPVFSHESGFYDSPFSLEIKAGKGLKVYYTLDSSEPTDNSKEYSSAIKIKDVTPQPNNLAGRTDLQPYRNQKSSKYYTKIKDGWFSRNIVPDNVDKCQVVRAVAVDQDGNRSNVVTASYFLGYEYKRGYDHIPVLSLVSDPDDLFSEETGILVNGATYNTMWQRGELDGIDNTHTLRKYCNTYKLRGRESERKVHLDYLDDKDHKLVFSQEAGIRLHGNQSRVTQSQKSFNLYARKSYDGNSTFLIPFFDNGLLTDKVTLMRGNDVRNYVLSEKMNHRTMDTQEYTMVQVFLDGEYWGVYAIQEKYNSKEYIKTHYNLNENEYILVKGTPGNIEVKHGDPDALKTSFNELKQFVKDHDLSKEENYKTVCSMMDMQSFIDGYAARLYVSDQDWNWHKNQYLLYFDRKWHWMVFDMDYGASWYNPAKPDTNTFTTTRIIKHHSLETDPFFPWLMKNENFRRQFLNTFLDLGNEVYEGKKMRKEMSHFQKKYKAAGILEAKRHLTDKYIDEGENSGYISGMHQMAEKMAAFFEQRLQYASGYAADYLGFTGDEVKVTIQNTNPKKGKIRINTITPALKMDGTWSGVYYTDCPVTLTAEPAKGYQFAGWEASEKGTLSDPGSPVTELSFTGNVTVKAIFIEKDRER